MALIIPGGQHEATKSLERTVMGSLVTINKSMARCVADKKLWRVRRHRKLVIREFRIIMQALEAFSVAAESDEFDRLVVRAVPFFDAQQKGAVEWLTRQSKAFNEEFAKAAAAADSMDDELSTEEAVGSAEAIPPQDDLEVPLTEHDRRLAELSKRTPEVSRHFHEEHLRDEQTPAAKRALQKIWELKKRKGVSDLVEYELNYRYHNNKESLESLRQTSSMNDEELRLLLRLSV